MIPMPRYISLQANLTLLVVIAGIAAVVQDSLAKSAPASYVNLHALFGALLWASVVARFHRRMHQSPRMLPIDIREFSRHLSRLVYLLLYILMLVRLIIGSPAAPHFQGYLGYGLIALITIQVLGDVAGRSYHSAKRAAQIARACQSKTPWVIHRFGDSNSWTAHDAGRHSRRP
jgi:cytochrome b561